MSRLYHLHIKQQYFVYPCCFPTNSATTFRSPRNFHLNSSQLNFPNSTFMLSQDSFMLAAWAKGKEWNLLPSWSRTTFKLIFWRINEQARLFWVMFMARNYRDGTNIITKPYTALLGEDNLVFFMAPTVKKHTFVSWHRRFQPFNLLAPELFFFLILAHVVYKMWIIQEPNTLELWKKLHFEGKKPESIYRV